MNNEMKKILELLEEQTQEIQELKSKVDRILVKQIKDEIRRKEVSKRIKQRLILTKPETPKDKKN